jgi:hypothetical protein
MRSVLAMRLSLLCFAAILAYGQDQGSEKFCLSGFATTVNQQPSVIVQRVVLSGTWGTGSIVIYRPNKESADGAVLLSHSAIRNDSGSTDLLPLAWTLAQAGAAVIVPVQSLVWPSRDPLTNHDGAVIACAGQWLFEHVKVSKNDRAGVSDKDSAGRVPYAYVGPRVCDPTVTSRCDLRTPFTSQNCLIERNCRDHIWVPMGEPDDEDNTDRIIKDSGLKAASRIQQHLGLAPIYAITTPIPLSPAP